MDIGLSSKNSDIEPIEDTEHEDGWLNIIGTGGLKKKVISPGIIESRPNKGDLVKIDAIGKLEDGTVVEELKDFYFTVEGGELIDGLDLIVKLMDKGEKAEVFMEARFAYGEKGLDNRVPPNSDLYYTVEILDFKPEENPEDMDIKARFDIGVQKRERGNWWFNREEYSSAIKCYKSSIDYLDDTSDTLGEAISDDIKQLLQERLITLNNMAAAQMKVEAFDMALMSLENVLSCHPNNVKALYRKGKILGVQGKSTEGFQVLKKALEIEPDSKPVMVEAAKLQKKAREEAELEKSLYRRMLGIKPGSTKKIEVDRYPTIRGRSIKMWATIFIVLFLGLLVVQYVMRMSD